MKTDEKKSPPGFFVYLNDWELFVDEFTEEEIGKLVIALISYAKDKTTECKFEDRAMRTIYNTLVKTIDRGDEKYELKCLKNKYAAYIKKCYSAAVTPLLFDDWLANNKMPSAATDGNRHSEVAERTLL